MAIEELPNGWIWTTLDDISEIILGQSPPSSTYSKEKNGLAFFQGKLEFGLIYPTPRQYCSKPKKIAEKGDILISVRAPVGPTNICPEQACIGRGLAAIRGSSGISSFFLLYLLRSIEKEIAQKGTGTTFGAITGNKLRGIELPLPPLNEQHRIVAKIESLFTKLDAGKKSLEIAEQQLKRYRQSVLKHAFSGKLTGKWRAAHKGELEPAKVLIERIKEERKKKLGKKYTELHLNGFSELPEIPKEWGWVTIEEICINIVDCLHSTPKFTQMGKYCIDTNCIEPGRINFEKTRFVSEEIYNDRTRRLIPKEGDILFAREGTIGTSVIVPPNMELCLGQRMMMFRLRMEIRPKYFMWVLQSPIFKHQSMKKMMGSTVQHLNIGIIKRMVIPIVPITEQNLIIHNIERYYASIDELNKSIYHNLLFLEKIKQSILKNAFEGRLVLQNSSDEPAEKLLERIKQDRIKQPIKEKRRRKSNDN